MTDQPTKPAGDLTPGDHLELPSGVARVLHVEPYINDKPHVAVLLDIDGTPETYRWPADHPVTPATDEQVTAAADQRRRERVAVGLARLAEMVEQSSLPLPAGMPLTIRVTCRTAVDVNEVAAELGVEARTEYSERVAEWRSHPDDDYGQRGSVVVRWAAYVPSKAAATAPASHVYIRELDPPAEPVPAGVEGHQVGNRRAA